MLNDLRIEKLTRQAIALMQEERKLALNGDLKGLAELGDRKAKFLEQMEEIATVLEKGHSTGLLASKKKELATLFEIIRRRAEENQYILKAAATGVRSAREHFEALTQGSSNLGVYNSEGEKLPNTERLHKTTGVY